MDKASDKLEIVIFVAAVIIAAVTIIGLCK